MPPGQRSGAGRRRAAPLVPGAQKRATDRRRAGNHRVGRLPGAIKLLVGADFNGTVLGTRVIEHHETPGLGDKIELRISGWISFFSGKKIEGPDDKRWAVKKDGGMFDQFTGATITPRAVVNAVRRTALYMETLPPKLESLPACGAAE